MTILSSQYMFQCLHALLAPAERGIAACPPLDCDTKVPTKLLLLVWMMPVDAMMEGLSGLKRPVATQIAERVIGL